MSTNPQAAQMGDESMARNLGFQARAIWPAEQRLFERYELAGAFRALDVGCGTGEITIRLAQRYPDAKLEGIDILPGNLAIAEARLTAFPDLASRVRFREADAFALEYGNDSFELVVCRHVSQAVPDFPRMLAELCRVIRPGGYLHLLSEDYGMLHMPLVPGRPNLDRFWVDVALPYLTSIQCDGRVGRHSLGLVRACGLTDARVDFVTVDTERVPREVLAGIFQAWRDGYTEPLATATERSPAEVRECFQAMIDFVNDPAQYVLWQLPIITAQKPG
ncbi:MAG: methyltransferase domain-containing protein [Myxococcales bacterium]|nr:methyltransferase domain-containing protein [Myxococcales bacterium]